MYNIFQRFLQQYQDVSEEISIPSLQNLLTFRWSAVMDASLVAYVTPHVIFSTLHSLPNDKVSGYDGYTKEFFIDAWSVVASEFITAAQYFFLYGFLPTWINATIMSLIPKVENALTMKKFRPIA